MRRWFAIFLLPLASGIVAAESHPALDVLEKNCIECHNAVDKKGGIGLQQAPLEIDDVTLILEAVSGDEPGMPPKRDPLSAGDVALLKNWIEQGAEIPESRVLKDTRMVDRKWWSLAPLVAPDVPQVGGTRARNEIDRFVISKLEEKGLSLSKEADPRTLIRRLTYDLTGLPPTLAEIADFLKSSQADADLAYQNLVDRLLASPRYGEQWARHWLDVARYGETHGYDKDKARFNAWPYRDYVIRSFNDDKAWTRFVQEQVAGDTLWPGDPDGIVALGFIAAGPWDYIAHTEVGEGKIDGRIAKHLDRDDMISAVFNAFMSTTVQCAQCHNHKFDPVSMEDYYRLHAVFAGVDRNDRVYDLDPKITKKKIGLEIEIADLEQKLKALDKAVEQKGGNELLELRTQISELEALSKTAIKKVAAHGYHSQIVKSRNTEKWIQLELPERTEIESVRLIGAYDDYAGIGSGFGFPLRFRVEASDDPSFVKNVVVLADYTSADFSNPGTFPVEIQGGSSRFFRVTATRLAERKNDYIFALAEVELVGADGKNHAVKSEVTSLDSIESGIRWGRKNLIDGKYTTWGDPRLPERLAVAKTKLSAILESLAEPSKRDALEEGLASAKQKLESLPKGKMVYSLATDFKPKSQFKPTGGQMRAIPLLNRGDVTSPGETMPPGAPVLWPGSLSVFELPESHTEGERRAALARYLVDPNNPLLWRSGVNRIWLGHFGRGIVDSPNDFGRMGMKPTHPELLDWLAVRFRETESVKDMHRLMVMSSTYRQLSTHDPDKSAIDGSNAYYWRMSRRKLRAEEVRDAILSVAGVLDLKMGGPSFRDFTFKDDHTPKYWYHLHDPADPDTHRRTIYRLIARSQTQPFLTTLDCADPSQMVAKRDETTTALQALAMMNNPFVIEMSQNVSKRVDSLDEAVELALGRPVSDKERDQLSRVLNREGMPAVARILFNLNEFSYVD